MPTRNERLEGGLVGMLIGDALGVPYEFSYPSEIPPAEEIEYVPPPYFRRAHFGTPPGTWSDDSAQALCLLASLLECGRFDAEDFGSRLLRWYSQGYMAVDERVYDVGVSTGLALSDLRLGVPALEAGRISENSNGNGSLMRVLPLALWHQGSDSDLIEDAQSQSCVTHRHLRSQLCCALYCLWARRILQEHPQPWEDGLSTLRNFYSATSPVLEELDSFVCPDAPPETPGSGYVVDCLRSSREAINAGSYESAVKAAIQMGRDTDTTACVTGGIAGVRDGILAIPERWRNDLRGAEIYRPLLEVLLGG